MIEQLCCIGKKIEGTYEYNIIAKTPSLKVEYINKHILPLCDFHILDYVEGHSEYKEELLQRLMIFPIHTGDMIISFCSYHNEIVDTLSPYLFFHYYILSSNEKRRYIKEPLKIFAIDEFKKDYHEVKGTELPTLAAISSTSYSEYFEDRELLFEELNITDKVFDKLINAILNTFNSSKKIYISLDVPQMQLNEMAKALLYHIYRNLPWKVTERLSVSTYSTRLESKKHIKIMFIDQLLLKSSYNLGEHILFDFGSGKVQGLEEVPQIMPYMKLYRSYVEDRVEWGRFNYWVHELNTSLSRIGIMDAAFLNRILLLIDIRKALKGGYYYDISTYKTRHELIPYLWCQLHKPIHEEIKVDIEKILDYIFELTQNRISLGELYTEEEIHIILEFKLDREPYNLAEEAHCIQIFLLLCEVAIRASDKVYINKIIEKASYYESLYIKFYKELYQNSKLRECVLYVLWDEALQDKSSIESIIEVIDSYAKVGEVVYNDTYFIKCIEQKLILQLEQSKDRVQSLQQIQNWTQDKSDDFYKNIRKRCELYFLEILDMDEISSLEPFYAIEFEEDYDNKKYQVLENLKRLKTDITFMHAQYIVLDEKLQDLLKRVYILNPSEISSYMLVYAFLVGDLASGHIELDTKGILKAICHTGIEEVLEFIIWIHGQSVYVNQETLEHHIKECLEEDIEDKKELKKLLKQKAKNNLYIGQLIKKVSGIHSSSLLQKIVHPKDIS